MAGKKKKQKSQTPQPSLKLSEKQQQKPGSSKQERQTKKLNRNETRAQESGGVLVTPKPKKPSVTDLWADYFQKGELSDWQRLCEDLGLPSDLPSKKQCRNVSLVPARFHPYHAVHRPIIHHHALPQILPKRQKENDAVTDTVTL